MKEMITTLKVDTIGRVMIPKHVREAMGIAPGDVVRVTVAKESIVSEKEGNFNAALVLA